MSDLCTDNRFELIEKYKKKLTEATNIETSTKEINVLDSILFRFWQMGWLDKLDLPSAQPKEQHGRVFKGIVVEYPSYNTYPEYIGKPYFSIKYTENGQEFIGYGTYNPEVLSEYLKEYFMLSAQPDLSEYSDKLWRAAYERGKKEAQSEIIHGYDIKHLMIIAEILRKENLPPERITEVLTDIGRIVSMVRDEFEEMLQKAVEQCKI